MEELHYISRFNSGDERAFQHLFHLFYNPLCFFARSITDTRLEAEDIVQDAFIQLWKHREGFDSLRAVKAFLYLAVKNSSRNLYKHKKVEDRYQMGHKGAQQEDLVMERIIEAEVLGEVHRALQKLPEGCRKVINLSYFKGLSNQEVASYLNVSVNTVKTQKLRALKILRLSFRHIFFWLPLLISSL
jgi:RNA polymerase sigma-70 factor (family 1)